jgi:hypothetical protein
MKKNPAARRNDMAKVTYQAVVRQGRNIIATCGHQHNSAHATSRCSNSMMFPCGATIAVEASDGHKIEMLEYFSKSQLEKPIDFKRTIASMERELNRG